MALVAHARQRGNPVLRHVRNVPVEFRDDAQLAADFLAGDACAVLFLSLQYHVRSRGYIVQRLQELRRRPYRARVLLVLADAPGPEALLRQLGVACVGARATLLVAFGPEEAARYLETLRAYEN